MFLLFEGQPTSAGNGDKEPEDIFSNVEEKKGTPPANLPVGASAPSGPSNTPPRAGEASPIPPPMRPVAPSVPQIEKSASIISNRTLLWGAGAVVVVVVLGFGSYGVARFLKKAQTAAPLATPTAPVIVETPVPEAVEEVPAVIDTDGDGLTDEQETTLGTDPLEADTDKDGLFDGEEGETYGTDPLNPDSDSDTFFDGQEVRNGYNPKGQGRLFEIPAE
ncbi:MAG: hypothetical protein AAB444_00710 [Patescibacteria group bacterium]